ncbi:LAFE_0E03972g1_1 [Lachancea fermentati]|uniref:LAFE_0E03972g1_1 n=1 Tax=Lachancea fermentati TaxID=4955 RepID=A0A1G4MCU0_LACFM|nr:LAFE_0E03972g1_1 [Lachancea fermentati]
MAEIIEQHTTNIGEEEELIKSTNEQYEAQPERRQWRKRISGSRRKHFRKWLQGIREPSPSVQLEDETVLLDIKDTCINSKHCLTFIPVYSSNELQFSNEKATEKHHIHKLKDFLRGHVSRKNQKQNSSSDLIKPTDDEERKRYHSLFEENVKELEILFNLSHNLKNNADALQDGTKQIFKILGARVAGEFECTVENDSSFAERNEDAPSTSSLKRPSCDDKTANKRICAIKDAQELFEGSSEYSGEPSTEGSICKTPSILLSSAKETGEVSAPSDPSPRENDSKSLTLERVNVMPENNSTVPVVVATAEQKENSEKPPIRLSTSSSECEPTQIPIPTFRQGHKRLDVSDIVENVTNGIMKNHELVELSRKEEKKLTFRDKSFYELESAASDEQTSTLNNAQDIMHTNSVKFDRVSYVFLYDASKQCRKFEDSKRRTKNTRERNPTEINFDPGYDGDSEVDVSKLQTKSILKSKKNERAELESVRADNCDQVDVLSFIRIFEDYESKRRKEETRLNFIRGQQLSQYYSQHSLPSSDMRLRSWSVRNHKADNNGSKNTNSRHKIHSNRKIVSSDSYPGCFRKIDVTTAVRHD